MKLYQYIIATILATAVAALCATELTAGERNAATLPDSLLTEDRVYELTFSDPDMAKSIIDEMRHRKLLPGHELDFLEGDLMVNHRYYDEAAALYLKALENDSVKNDPATHMSLLHRMITCYDGRNDNRNTTKYVKLLLDEARKNHDKPMESIALFNMGKLSYYQEDKELAYKLMYEAIGIMKQSDYAYKYDNLRYDYNTLAIMLQRDERYEEAYNTLIELENVVTASTEAEPEIKNLAQKELKTLYAQQAIILHKLGRDDMAEVAYGKWKKAAPEYTADDYIIAPYLTNSGRPDEAIKIYTDYEQRLRQRGDTISYHMRSILRSLGLTYYRTGRYKNSAEYFLRLANVTDSLKVREQNSSAQELATAYDTHRKETELIKRSNSLRLRNAWLVGTVAALILLLVLMSRQMRHTRLIKKKNMALVENIQDLLAYKSELDRLKQLLPQQETEEYDRQASESTGTMSNYEIDNHHIFERLDRQINNEQLFLNPDLTRDDLLRIAHTDKNRLAKIMQQHEFANTSDYINRKRLEYAATQLNSHPEYTINAIAESCGLPNVPTFNRLFRKNFGMTPTEFRKATKEQSHSYASTHYE